LSRTIKPKNEIKYENSTIEYSLFENISGGKNDGWAD
jgi:hypothetical protein